MSNPEVIGVGPAAATSEQVLAEEIAFRAAVLAGTYIPSWTRREMPKSSIPANDWDWEDRGACKNVDTEVFYSPEGERGPARVRREEKAKAICRECPVIQTCLHKALERREPFGVWGGLAIEEREALLSRRTA